MSTAASAVLPAACTSDIQGIDAPVSDPAGEVAGIYSGAFRITGLDAPVEASVFIADDRSGRALLFGIDEPVIASGVYDASQGAIDWNARLFRLPAEEGEPGDDEVEVEVDGATAMTRARDAIPVRVLQDDNMTTWSGTGQYTPETGLSINFVTADGSAGSVQVDYLPDRYDRFRLLSDAAGVWETRDAFGNPVASYTISEDGSISGQDASCTYSGRMQQPDTAFNLYALRLQVQCGEGGDLVEGLATLYEPDDGVEQLEMVAASESMAVLLVISRVQ